MPVLTPRGPLLLQIAFAPLRAGELAAMVGVECIDYPPLAWHLPGRQMRQRVLLQRVSADGLRTGNTGNDGLAATGIGARNSKRQTGFYLWMACQDSFDHLGDNLSPGDIDLIGSPALQV